MIENEKLLRAYKEWSDSIVKDYGDFDSSEQLTFKETKKDQYIFVGHPEGAEDYGEGESGGVNGSIETVAHAFNGLFNRNIEWDTKKWKEYWDISKAEMRKVAKGYGLVIDDDGLVRVARCKTWEDAILKSRSPICQIREYLSFFNEINCYSLDDMFYSYFTYTIPGHDDYYCITVIDGIAYLFWITRYDPNF